MTLISPPLLVFLLASVSIAGLLWTLVLPVADGINRRKRRIAFAAGVAQSNVRQAGGKKTDSARRRREIEQTLREIEARRSEVEGRRRKTTLKNRLREAGLSLTPRGYIAITALCVPAFALLFIPLLPIWTLAAMGFGAAFGLVLPHAVVSHLRKRRLNRFATDFPDVLDIMVRGVRAGRPLGDCLAIVATDSAEPIRGEFRKAVEDSAIGLPVDEVIQRLADRVPLQEVNFVAIVVTIQARTGGSLTEALANLSTVLRGRKQLRAKVKALSAEAKSSAAIIGSLPICVAGLMQFTTPDYIALLYTTTIGQIVLACSALWMGTGILVMRQMINFDM